MTVAIGHAVCWEMGRFSGLKHESLPGRHAPLPDSATAANDAPERTPVRARPGSIFDRCPHVRHSFVYSHSYVYTNCMMHVSKEHPHRVLW